MQCSYTGCVRNWALLDGGLRDDDAIDDGININGEGLKADLFEQRRRA